MNKLANIENEHYIVNLKMEYEERMKGLLPIEVRKVIKTNNLILCFYLIFNFELKGFGRNNKCIEVSNRQTSAALNVTASRIRR